MRRFCLLFAGISFFALAAGQGASPEINAPYRNPSYEQWRSRFETEGREVYDQRHGKLAPASIDLAFICDAYHHFEQPKAMLASIRRALRPGGTLIVVDFERIPGVSPDWILKHVRAGKEDFRAEIEAAGFGFVEEVKLMRENYVLRFSRD
jgi:SAM-dependent methyltransferase